MEEDSVPVPGGRVVLGAARNERFRWDNEHPELAVDVAPFRIDALPVTNREYREFVADGGDVNEPLRVERSRPD